MSLLLFPGQGSQKVGMGKDLADAFPRARETFHAIDAALDEPITPVMWEGPEDKLVQTECAQPAILAHSAAALAAVGERLEPVAGAVGHSLGEYSAYLAAGVFSPAAAARLVRARGRLMREAGERQPGTMAAVLGLPAAEVERACKEASAGEEIAVAANLNTADQTVISGTPTAVTRAGELCKAAGAKRVQPLKVSGAFHSPLMASAADGLRDLLDEAELADPRFPVVANATAEPVHRASEARLLLADQLTAPVRWLECVQQLAVLAPEARFVEVGPGTVLGGLLKRILPGRTCVPLGTAADVERFLH
ncbi:MAG: ACP S-malonyltransferase [Gemmatimonadales bacterium]